MIFFDFILLASDKWKINQLDFLSSYLEFDTNNSNLHSFTWFPARTNEMILSVRAKQNAIIAFSSTEALVPLFLQVFIGFKDNTETVIRKDSVRVTGTATPEILSEHSFRRFRIRWSDNVLTVRRESETAPFMTYNIVEPFPINFLGFTTGRWEKMSEKVTIFLIFLLSGSEGVGRSKGLKSFNSS